MGYQKEIEDLIERVNQTLINIIEEHGGNCKLEITDEDCQFNLGDNGNYINGVIYQHNGSARWIDDCENYWELWTLDSDDLCFLVDFLCEKYKLDNPLILDTVVLTIKGE